MPPSEKPVARPLVKTLKPTPRGDCREEEIVIFVTLCFSGEGKKIINKSAIRLARSPELDRNAPPFLLYQRLSQTTAWDLAQQLAHYHSKHVSGDEICVYCEEVAVSRRVLSRVVIQFRQITSHSCLSYKVCFCSNSFLAQWGQEFVGFTVVSSNYLRLQYFCYQFSGGFPKLYLKVFTGTQSRPR